MEQLGDNSSESFSAENTSQQNQHDPANMLPWLAAEPDEARQLRTQLAKERAANKEAATASQHSILELERAKSELRRLRLEAQHWKGKTEALGDKERRLIQKKETPDPRLQSLEKQLLAANAKIEKLGRNRPKVAVGTSWLVWVVVASVLAITAGVVLTHASWTPISAKASSPAEEVPQQQLKIIRRSPVDTDSAAIRSDDFLPRFLSQGMPRASAGQEKLNESLARLSTALALFGGESAQDVIGTVNAKQPPNSPQACPFQWRSDGPALSLQFKDGKVQTIESALDQCSSAIERYRP